MGRKSMLVRAHTGGNAIMFMRSASSAAISRLALLGRRCLSQSWRYGLSVVVTWLTALTISLRVVAGWFGDSAAAATTRNPKLAPPESLLAATRIASAHLMGIGPERDRESLPPTRYRLIGVMSAGGSGKGFAVLVEDDKPAMAVLEGEAVAPGIILARVMPEQVELLRGGRKETLRLPRAAQPTGGGAGDLRQPPAPLPQPVGSTAAIAGGGDLFSAGDTPPLPDQTVPPSSSAPTGQTSGSSTP